MVHISIIIIPEIIGADVKGTKMHKEEGILITGIKGVILIEPPKITGLIEAVGETNDLDKCL